jgi:hypothetical protein
MPKESKMREEEEGQGKRRRKILESNPTTLELAESEKPSNAMAFNIMTNAEVRD